MKYEKYLFIDWIVKIIRKSSFIIIADNTKINVEAISILRNGLKENLVELHIVKNTFLKRALKENNILNCDIFCKGPTFIITGKGENNFVKSSNKVVSFFKQNNKEAQIKGAYYDKTILGLVEIKEIARLPEVKVLYLTLLIKLKAVYIKLLNILRQKALRFIILLQMQREKI